MNNHLETLLYYDLLIIKLIVLRYIKFTTIIRWGFENYLLWKIEIWITLQSGTLKLFSFEFVQNCSNVLQYYCPILRAIANLQRQLYNLKRSI